jgi:hypothetical protein
MHSRYDDLKHKHFKNYLGALSARQKIIYSLVIMIIEKQEKLAAIGLLGVVLVIFVIQNFT